MAFLSEKDLKNSYDDSRTESLIWKEDYPAFERLMDNGLMDGLDPNLPEVNDGSLAAALFKLPKRIVSSDLTGSVKALDRDEAWMSELANIQWQNNIIPHANSQAPFHRKWKDAVRKAAGYGGVPIINLFVDRTDYRGSDFIVVNPQDVILEAGKVSDYDSDVIYWEVYYTKLQVQNMIEEAKEEQKEAKAAGDDEEGYNRWDIPALEDILKGNQTQTKSAQDTPRADNEKGVHKEGFKFCIAFQRGVDAPFYMYHSSSNKVVRTWTNPDPTGDIPVHFLYCYQDFVNPYGVGIVKLAGGTQNVLDYMRQADVLATQLGLRPPINIAGDADSADIDSLVYAQDALWFTGDAKVERMELASGVYNQLPGRIQMYKTSLNQILPTGDTSATSAQTGDPTQSKTPAGVKMVAAQLSIDDEDFKDNLYMTYAAVAKSMINVHFANMEGKDMMKLTDDEREILIKGGLQFPTNEQGEMSNQLEIDWDTVRANFDFEVDPDQDKAKDDEKKLEGLTKVAELMASDPTLQQQLAESGKRLNTGELFSEIIKLTSDNDKIITDISGEEQSGQAQIDPTTGQPMPPQDPNAQQGQAPQAAQTPVLPVKASVNYKDAPPSIQRQMEVADGWEPATEEEHAQQVMDNAASTAQNVNQATTPDQQQTPQPDPNAPQPTPEEMQANVQAIMQQYGVDENTALAALAAEHQGFPVEDVVATLQKYSQGGKQ